MQLQDVFITQDSLGKKLNDKPSTINADHATAEYIGLYRYDAINKTYHVVIADYQHEGEPLIITNGTFTSEDRAQAWMDKTLKAYDQDLPEPPDDLQLAH